MGSAGFALLPHACLPLYFVILLRQSILILEFFCLSSVSHSYADPQSSRIRIRHYELFRQQTGEYDLTKHAETFPHSFFPFFGPSFLFFFCFSGGNALQKRTAGCLGATNYSSGSKRTLVVASMWWTEEVELWKRAERTPHTDTTLRSNYTATKSRLSKGTTGEVDRRSLFPKSGRNRQLIINLINRSAGSLAINGVGDRYFCDTTMYCMLITPYEKRLGGRLNQKLVHESLKTDRNGIYLVELQAASGKNGVDQNHFIRGT